MFSSGNKRKFSEFFETDVFGSDLHKVSNINGIPYLNPTNSNTFLEYLNGQLKYFTVNSDIIDGILINGNFIIASPIFNKIKDSGINSLNVITSSGTLTSGNLISGNGSKTIQDSGLALSNVVIQNIPIVSRNVVYSISDR